MKAFKIPKPADETIKEILLFLFEQNRISGVFALSKINSNNYGYTLITDKELLNNISPTIPLMPANAGKLISNLTMIESVTLPTVVVLRPCELRALFELVKLEQAKLDNIFFVSFTCGGVFPTKIMKDGLQDKLEKYWENTKTAGDLEDLRESCRVCEHFIPDNADIILPLVGENNISHESTVLLKSEKGEKLLIDKTDQFIELDLKSKNLDNIINKRTEQKNKIYGAFKTEDFGVEGLTKLFGRCINCHACSKACPACYCKLCFFESTENEYNPSTLEIMLNNRGALRLPTDTVFYHLGRLIHVGITCVGCGMCSDACPTNIPVSTLFAKAGERVQQLFNYVPGRNIDEKIPITTFEDKELTEIED
jgi:formate dehydrogenase subunit beta